MSKTFKGSNPALPFLQQEGAEQSIAPAETTKDISQGNTQYTEDMMRDKYRGIIPIGQKPERVTHRLNLLIKPSTALNIRKITAMRQVSMNSILNEVLEEFTRQEHEAVVAYDKLFGQEE